MKIFYVFFLAFFVVVFCEEKVELVINFTRHGARLSDNFIHIEPKGPLHLEKMGLTPVGMKQHYLLGKKLRKDYGDVIPNQIDYKYVQVYSSSSSRCIISARSQLQGLFEDKQDEKLQEKDTKKINTFKGYTDIVSPQKNLYKYVYPYKVDTVNVEFRSHAACSKLKQKLDYFYDNRPQILTENLKNLENQLLQFGYTPQATLKKDKFEYKDILHVCGWIVSRNYLFSNTLFKTSDDLFSYCQTFISFNNYYKVSSQQIRQLTNYNILTVMMQKLRAKRDQNTLEKDLKFVLLSGHDTNLAAFLNIFGPFHECYEFLKLNKELVKNQKEICQQKLNYASSVIIELVNVIENDSEKLMIQIKLNGVYLKLFDGQQKIELNNFLTKLNEEQDIAFQDYCQDIYIKPPINQDFQLQFLTLSILTIITFILIGVCMYFALGSQEQENSISNKDNDMESQLSKKDEQKSSSKKSSKQQDTISVENEQLKQFQLKLSNQQWVSKQKIKIFIYTSFLKYLIHIIIKDHQLQYSKEVIQQVILNDVKSFNKKKKQQKIEEVKNKRQEKEIDDQQYKILSRFKSGNKKYSINLQEHQINDFSQSIAHIIRLDCFKAQVHQRLKVIKKPTQKNPQSKKTLNQFKRQQFIKDRKVQQKKEKQEKKQRQEFLHNLAKGIKTSK